jgi:hypothetical protein
LIDYVDGGGYMKKMVFMLFCILAIYSFPSYLYATLFNYNVAGTLSGSINGQDEQFIVTGNVVIDGTLMMRVGQYTYEPVPPGSEINPNSEYDYSISKYSLKIASAQNSDDSNIFTGNGGNLWFDLRSGSKMWELYSFGWGEPVCMYNTDMTSYLWSDMGTLAPIIELMALYNPNSSLAALYPFDGNWAPTPTFDIILTQTAPVPEPATILLLSSSLLGLAGFRRKLKK